MADDVKNIWAGFLGSLMLDVDDALRRQESQDSPTTRRGLIRTLIAAVEGLAWIYREHVLGIAKEMGRTFGQGASRAFRYRSHGGRQGPDIGTKTLSIDDSHDPIDDTYGQEICFGL